VDKHRTELQSRCRGKNETLQSLHADIRRLAALAFPTVEHTAREAMATDYFLDAIGASEFALRVRDRQPKELDTAFAIALQMEAWMMFSRNRKNYKAEFSRYQRGSAMAPARKYHGPFGDVDVVRSRCSL